jgi:NAD(P)-dependent dehydrogenase (short-subunit alcohol dehydrogenase family)
VESIFVTGAASGIGWATAELFAAKGWRIGAADRDPVGLARLVDRLGADRCHAEVFDVTDEGAYRTALGRFTALTGGRLDVLFNCAGVLRCGAFERQSALDDELMLRINVLGVTTGIRAALDVLKATPGARIISMASAASIYGVPEEAVYSASKFAVRGLTEALDIELEPYGIRVCDVMPPVVRTPMVTEQRYQPGVNQSPATWASAEQVAEVVWQAAHRHRLHWLTSREVRILARLIGLIPSLGRTIMQRYSGYGSARPSTALG